MTTTILILCFSAIVILLVMAYSTRLLRASNRTSERMAEKTATLMETLIRQSSITTQTLSTDSAETVKAAHQTMTDLYLGRDSIVSPQSESNQPATDKQLVPGIETLDGLPTNVAQALQREYSEEKEPREWQTVFSTPNNGSEPMPPSPSMTQSEQRLEDG
jgi:hypothetical protein